MRMSLGHLGHVFFGACRHLGHLGHVFLCDPNDPKRFTYKNAGFGSLGHLGHFGYRFKSARVGAFERVHRNLRVTTTVLIYSTIFYFVIYKQ